MENKSITQTVTCKKCGKIHSIECYPIINLQSSDKEFLNKVFSLELFKVHCDCGAETIVQYDTVIIDMYKKYIIYLYINGSDEEFYESVKPALDKMLTENEEYKKIYDSLVHTRLVRSINDMLEKLLIYDYDLDDRIVEFIKYSLITNEQFVKDEIALVYFDKIDKTNLIFTAISKNQEIQPKSVGIDISYYNKMMDLINIKELPEIPFAKIDSSFVLHIISTATKNQNIQEEQKESEQEEQKESEQEE